MPPERIVILDGYATNPGDLDWTPLTDLGRLEVHDRTDPAQIAARIGSAAYVLLNKTLLTRQTLQALTTLRYVGVLATGYDAVDVEAARAQGVIVTNVPAYSSDSVAQHAAALMLDLARGLSRHIAAVKAGEWSHGPDWCLTLPPVMELNGKTLGIVGYGRIGASFGKIASAMGMTIIASPSAVAPTDRAPRTDVRRVSLEELFEVADVVSLHCPLTDETRHLVDAATLRRMKTSALLINTSRGQLVDELALAEALRRGEIAGAALDVLNREPPPPDHPLLAAPNCIVTPHVAWATLEARRRLIKVAADNLAAFMRGAPHNVV